MFFTYVCRNERYYVNENKIEYGKKKRLKKLLKLLQGVGILQRLTKKKRQIKRHEHYFVMSFLDKDIE